MSQVEVNFFGTWIDQQNEPLQVEQINAFVASNSAHYVTYSNVHVVVTAHSDEALRRAVNEADIASPDGKPMEFVARLKGLKEFRRCTGPDMMLALLEESERKGYTNYFYGSTQETLDQLKEKLLQQFPNLKILKMYSPPFRPLSLEEENAIIGEMNSLSPDLIWVGLGAPKQEKWMHAQRSKLQRGVMLGVGAAFDFHAAKLKRAPRWMQQIGLEWFFRLMSEPRRLFKRYFVTNTLFVLYLLRYGIKVRTKAKADPT
jgi:N-acetylglucosaminyldiphosphoundecaprenol N-acetyl-beta-D-mannosaminyltransferase